MTVISHEDLTGLDGGTAGRKVTGWAGSRAEMVCLLPCAFTLLSLQQGRPVRKLGLWLFSVTPLSHWGLLGVGNETRWDKWPGGMEDQDWTLPQGK